MPGKPTKAAPESCGVHDAGPLIDAKIAALGDWRSATLASLRRMIRQVDPAIIEEVKWRKPSNPLGVPVWSHAGILCTGETYRDKVKLTFAQGASLPDPLGLFNASLDGGTRRAIDLRDGEVVDEAAFKVLVAAAVTFNIARRRKPAPQPDADSPAEIETRPERGPG